MNKVVHSLVLKTSFRDRENKFAIAKGRSDAIAIYTYKPTKIVLLLSITQKMLKGNLLNLVFKFCERVYLGRILITYKLQSEENEGLHNKYLE